MDKNKLKQEIEEYLAKEYCCEFKEECKDGVRIRCSEYEAKLYLILRFAEPKEELIEQLKKENAELKSGCGMCYRKDKDQLNKAKEIIKNLIRFQPYINRGTMFTQLGVDWKESIFKAEQFLKEIDIKRELFPEITLPKGSAELVDKVIADAEKRLKKIE